MKSDENMLKKKLVICKISLLAFEKIFEKCSHYMTLLNTSSEVFEELVVKLLKKVD